MVVLMLLFMLPRLEGCENMKKGFAVLLCLFLLLVLVPKAVTNPDDSTYDPMADVNRDGIVDIHDLNRLGEAYGSSLVLPSEPSKTVVTVLSFDKEPPEVENARVAIIDPEVYKEAVDVKYTNSSGIVTFDLTPNMNYTAIAWSDSAYNYANFTTNSLNEASVMILLGEPSLPPIRSLPKEWIVVTVIDNETGSVFFTAEFCLVAYQMDHVEFDYPPPYTHFVYNYTNKGVFGYIGVMVIPPDWQFNEPHSLWALVHFHSVWGYIGCYGSYSPDANGCANVIVYVDLP